MEPPPPPPPHRLTLTTVLSDSDRILTANTTHFTALSLFFLPLSLHLITTPHLSDHLLHISIVYSLTLCAISTITYTTHHRLISGTPVNFLTSVSSLSSSFFPIVTTAIISHALIFLILLALPLFVGANLMLLHNLGFHFVIDYKSTCFLWMSIVTCVTSTTIAVYVHVNWSLALVVAVVESRYGVEALKRSSSLVKGMRSVALLLCLYYGFFVAISVWVLSDNLRMFSDQGYVVFVVTLGCCLLLWFFRQYVVATTVLYNYCKDFHGELAVDGLDEKVALVVVEA